MLWHLAMRIMLATSIYNKDSLSVSDLDDMIFYVKVDRHNK